MYEKVCRSCQSRNLESVLDLGMSPLSQNFLPFEKLNDFEEFYPLHLYVCTNCWLVQLEEYVSGKEIFQGEYLYLSSYSDSWVNHAKDYADLVTNNFFLDQNKFVIEIASNDGYLLQWFKGKKIPVLGIEPSETCSKVALEKGIPTEVIYFGAKSAVYLKKKFGSANLLIGNNVLAHVPQLNDFIAGMKIILAKDGVFTMEFPHLKQLVEKNQFDTIYHEHFSYFSLMVVKKIFASHSLFLFDAEEIPTHGGSLRIYGAHIGNKSFSISDRYLEIIEQEKKLGMNTLQFYSTFKERVKETKRNLLRFLIEKVDQGRKVVGYGAPAKGNTLLNYCGIKTDLLDYVVDRSTHKIGKYLPGTHIPIYAPQKIRETEPDYVLILPWNIKDEIIEQMSFISDWGGKFVVPIPDLNILDSERILTT